MSASIPSPEEAGPCYQCWYQRCVMKWDIAALMARLQRVCIIQAVLNLIYLIYYIMTEPLVSKATVLITVSVCFSVLLGAWGRFAAKRKARVRLIIYLLLTVVVQSILVSSNITIQYSVNDRCDLNQSAYRGCDLDCARWNNCTIDDLDGTDCAAPPKEQCDNANNNKYIAAVVIQTFAACLPSCFSFIAIVRISKFDEDEEATYGKYEKFTLSSGEEQTNTDAPKTPLMQNVRDYSVNTR